MKKTNYKSPIWIMSAATVTAQMRSGLVVTFLFYPVEDLAQNVHRCVLIYNRDEVVARRRAAGLPVNLDDNEQGGEKKTAQSAAALTTIDVEKLSDDKLVEKTVNSRVASSPQTDNKTGEVKNSHASPPLDSSGKADPNSINNSEIATYLRNALDQAAKQPKKLKNWT